MKKRLLLSVLLAAVLFCVACGQPAAAPEKSGGTIVIASKPMSEQFVLTEMMKLVLEEKTDLQVELKQGIGGGTSNIHPALLKGDIDAYPEYSGTGWLFVLKEELINNPDELYNRLTERYREEYGLEWLGRFGFNNTFALAMDGAKADEMGIESYSDLAAGGTELVFGGEYDFYEREDGFPGLVEAYGFDFADTSELDLGLKYQAVAEGEVDVINAFSTDGLLREYGLKVLTDDLYFFPSYEAGIVIRQETLEAYPEAGEALSLLNGIISDEEMTEMNYYVEKEHRDPEKVAREFLEAEGVI